VKWWWCDYVVFGDVECGVEHVAVDMCFAGGTRGDVGKMWGMRKRLADGNMWGIV
jgi:hypothetical protein